MFEKEVREFFYILKFVKDGLSLTALVQRKKGKFNEETKEDFGYSHHWREICLETTTFSGVHEGYF